MGVLREILVAMTFPLALTLAVLVLAGIVAMLRFRRTAIAIAVLAVGWSVFWSVPRNAQWLRLRGKPVEIQRQGFAIALAGEVGRQLQERRRRGRT